MQFIYKPALWDSRILVVNPLNSQVIRVERSFFLTQYHKCITLETAIMEANPVTTMASTKFIIRTSVSQALKKYVSEELHYFQKNTLKYSIQEYRHHTYESKFITTYMY